MSRVFTLLKAVSITIFIMITLIVMFYSSYLLLPISIAAIIFIVTYISLKESSYY